MKNQFLFSGSLRENRETKDIKKRTIVLMKTPYEIGGLQELEKSIPKSDLENLSIVCEGDRLFAKIYIVLTVFALTLTFLGL